MTSECSSKTTLFSTYLLQRDGPVTYQSIFLKNSIPFVIKLLQS